MSFIIGSTLAYRKRQRTSNSRESGSTARECGRMPGERKEHPFGLCPRHVPCGWPPYIYKWHGYSITITITSELFVPGYDHPNATGVLYLRETRNDNNGIWEFYGITWRHEQILWLHSSVTHVLQNDPLSCWRMQTTLRNESSAAQQIPENPGSQSDDMYEPNTRKLFSFSLAFFVLNSKIVWLLISRESTIKSIENYCCLH